MTQPLYQPSEDAINASRINDFIRHVNETNGLTLDGFEELYDWSVREPATFWGAMAEYGGVIFHTPPEAVFEPGETFLCASWFRGAKLNFAQNLLKYRDDQPALVFRNEAGDRRTFSYAELYDEVSRASQALRAMGVVKGDRVAGFMPNMPETIIAMLATSSIGAIWSSCSPDFGVKGVLDRFGQIEPKVLFAADGYHYNGKQINSLHRVHDFLESLPSVEKVVVVPHLNETPNLEDLDGAVVYYDFVAPFLASEIRFESLPFDHPLYIMYSSGTTGLPKSIVHGQGGTLLQHLKELMLHTDLRREETIFYFTTCGWMMWNWLVSSLAVGATVVLFDGSPFHPDGHTLWTMAEEEGVHVFGTSAKYLSAVEKAGIVPGKEHNLEALRAVLSTGSPLAPEQFDWVYEAIKPDLQLASISGGTDIVSCFALGNPTGPVWRGELQTRGLGMAVNVFNEDGRPVVGEKGELVCEKPFPSRPIYFWNDETGERYRRAYFSRFENIWTHGDFAELTERGGMVIHGRSDAVLNPGGVRIGTAEIYRVVESFDEVVESICIGQEWQEDVRVVLFVRLREGLTLDDDLRDRLRKEIRREETPRHVPAKILQVTDIPRTISGKITELAVRSIIHGKEVKNRDALKNPETLDLFKDLDALKT
ncbi:acetoacetate--CoA ligase [bacterium]|nr:acetoacetate--CoA ligase [bacterium]